MMQLYIFERIILLHYWFKKSSLIMVVHNLVTVLWTSLLWCHQEYWCHWQVKRWGSCWLHPSDTEKCLKHLSLVQCAKKIKTSVKVCCQTFLHAGVAEEAMINLVGFGLFALVRDRMRQTHQPFLLSSQSLLQARLKRWQLDILCSSCETAAGIMCSHLGSKKVACQSSESIAHKKKKSERTGVCLGSRSKYNWPR